MSSAVDTSHSAENEAGEKPPHEFTREEVADILISAYAE